MSGWRSSGRPDDRAHTRRREASPFADEFGEPARRPARPDPLEIVTRLGWRYRHELAPFYFAFGLAILASIGHDYAPRSWPIVLPVGAAVTAAVWHWWADRTEVEVYVLAVGGAATVWTTIAWWASPWHDWLLWTALLGAVAGGIPRWWHYRRRGKLIVKPGAARGARRELRRIMRNWLELAEDMELAGSDVLRAEADETGYALTLKLRPGRTAADVAGTLARVESVLQTRPGAARLEPDPDRANRVVVRIVQTDPLSKVIPWPGSTATSIVEPLVLGRFANGELVPLSVVGEHLLVGGATGKGKSGMLNAIVAELSVRGDVTLWGIDMKLGLELAPWRRVLGRLAVNEEEAYELLAAANRVLDARARLLASRTDRKWRPSPEEPALVIAVDELAELSADSLALFERLARMGRATGIILVAVTQRPSVEALGSLDARTQLTVRIALGVIEARDTELILGSGRLSDGWRAEKLGPPGSFFVLAPGQHERPRRARAYWLDDDDVRAAASRSDVERPTVESPSHDDAAGPQRAPERGTRPAEMMADPDAALLAALGEAPDGGLSVAVLARRVGRRRTWVYERLKLHEHGGQAIRLRRGRWAARRGGPAAPKDDA